MPPKPPSSPPSLPLTSSPAPSNVALPEFGKKEIVFKPPKIILNAMPGFGKTTIAAYMPVAGIIQAKGETGYETLLGNGLVPHIPSTTVESWEALIGLLDSFLVDENFECKSLALDAMSGFERLLHNFICERDHKGDWSDRGFMNYHKGHEVSAMEWINLLDRLDKLREKGVMILILSHSKVANFKNPMEGDYDYFSSDIHPKVWAATNKWATATLFGKFKTIIDKDEKTKRNKGIGGTERVIYTQNSDAYIAKNQYNMPVQITIPNDPKESWNTIWKHIYKPQESEATSE